MATKRIIDWEAIEREYRAGQLTLREIASKRGISAAAIVLRAKRYNWERDLSERVRLTAQAKLNRGVNKDPVTEAEIVEEASDRAVLRIEGHLSRSARLAAIADKTMAAMEQIQAGEQPLFSPFQGKSDGWGNLLRAVQDVTTKSHDLDRRALNLDDVNPDDNVVLAVRIPKRAES